MVHTESLFSHFNFETGLLFSAIETLIAIYTLLVCHHYFYWPEQQAGDMSLHIALYMKKQRRQRPTGPPEEDGAATLPSLKSLSGSRLIIHDCLNRIVSKESEMCHIRHPKPDSSLFDNIPIKPHPVAQQHK
ncbi:hypothetical protein [Aeromonas allosaccharophila]|uniref:hypothetical protein n=1 Tax=Aeromonas allosaccharophila TaxID=656 RepID=UPI0036D88DEB